MAPNRVIKVFIASPGDLAIERRAFKEVIDSLNKGFGRGKNVTFEALGWEDALAQVGRRPQALINKDVDVCNVFILVMWRRWGQKAPDAKARGFTSYTEEEFYRALKRMERTKAPTICTFFKAIETGEMASPGPDLKRVLKFRKKLEQSKQVLWRGFAGDTDFRNDIERHLIAFANGELEPANEPVAESLLPDSALAEIKKLREEAQKAVERAERAERAARKEETRTPKFHKKTALKNRSRSPRSGTALTAASELLADARASERSLELAESAAKAAIQGRVEEARQKFAAALDGTANLQILYLGFEFFLRVDELDEAERLVRRWLSISGPDAENADSAAASGNLGLIEMRRGNLDKAETYHKKSLAVHEKLVDLDGMASQYGNLGLIELCRDNVDEADRYLRKSLALHEKLGSSGGIATGYGNLGHIERSRGNLDEAEAYAKKSLSLFENLENPEGIAHAYYNLGLIERTRGRADEAESYLKKSLAIYEKIGTSVGMANAYNSLADQRRTRPHQESL